MKEVGHEGRAKLPRCRGSRHVVADELAADADSPKPMVLVCVVEDPAAALPSPTGAALRQSFRIGVVEESPERPMVRRSTGNRRDRQRRKRYRGVRSRSFPEMMNDELADPACQEHPVLAAKVRGPSRGRSRSDPF